LNHPDVEARWMVRQANPIDFWRGLALVMIFVNHIPGIYYSRFTHAAYSISDSADLFVFLAGWTLRYVVGSPGRKSTAWQVVVRLGGRAFELYAAQILISVIAIAMLAGVALRSNNPLFLEWHNAASVFFNPVPTLLGLAVISHHLGYFDILPLYIGLLLLAPAFALLDRYAPSLVLPLSVSIYAITLGFQISVPTWPVEGEWFFNPLAWQLIFVLGFVLAREDGLGGLVRRHITTIRIAAIPVVIASIFVVRYGLWPDPTRLPAPKLFFVLSKTYATPGRIIQFLALVAVFSATYPYLKRYVSLLVESLALLGRNSLYVFCVASILSLAGQIVRFFYQGNIYADTLIIISGVGCMMMTAWLVDWRKSWKER
jgi:hypothetical protein